MNSQKYYALTLDNYATPGFISCKKHYFGTLDDVATFVENLKQEDNHTSVVEAFEKYKSGDVNVTHNVAYNPCPFLTPVTFHHMGEQRFKNKKWVHINIYGFPYEMHADKIKVEKAIITSNRNYYLCIKVEFINLSYKDEFAPMSKRLIRHGWGYPHVLNYEKNQEGQRVTRTQFFHPIRRCYTYAEAKHVCEHKRIKFDLIIDDIFADG